MKKIMYFVVCLCLIALFTTTVFAEMDNAEVVTHNLPEIVTDEVIEAVSAIPLYVTNIYNWECDDADYIKESANETLYTFYEELEQNYNSIEGLHYTKDDKHAFIISKVSDKDKMIFLKAPEYKNIFMRAYELIKQDVAIHYINIFLPVSENAKASSGNINDPSYWENACAPLCPSGGSNVYNGYKFLFIEASINVETTPKVADNIRSMNWVSIIGKITKLLADVKVKNAYYRSAQIAYDALAAVFSGHTAPYSVIYSAASGYLKTWISGDLYIRTILISDNLNRVSGYAYYDWGSLEKLKCKTKVDAKWPISVRAGGNTYEYDTNTYTSPNWRTEQTPGFEGNTTLYRSVVTYYLNSIGYFRHIETIDVDAAIASLL